ncbi:hypothetical protein KC460_05215, partial [Candidatus Dependentiae bacterium]|nr:hypothetical protein [Candidatus Dependentiae bacterium]
MTLCGLGLLAWVKPNQLYKNEEERKFNDSISDYLGFKNAIYKQDFEVNAKDYLESVINGSYSFPDFQSNSDSFFEENTDTIKSEIKRNINDRKNKTFLPWLFSKIIRSNTTENEDEGKANLMKSTALYYLYKKNVVNTINSVFYSFFFRQIIKNPYSDTRMTITFGMDGMLRVNAEPKQGQRVVYNTEDGEVFELEQDIDLATLIQAVTKISRQKYKCITDWHEAVRSEVEKIPEVKKIQKIEEKENNPDGDSSKNNNNNNNNTYNNLKEGASFSVAGGGAAGGALNKEEVNKEEVNKEEVNEEKVNRKVKNLDDDSSEKEKVNGKVKKPDDVSSDNNNNNNNNNNDLDSASSSVASGALNSISGGDSSKNNNNNNLKQGNKEKENPDDVSSEEGNVNEEEKNPDGASSEEGNVNEEEKNPDGASSKEGNVNVNGEG